MTCCEIWKSKVRITTWLQRLDGSASISFVWLCSCDVAVESDPLGCTLVKLAASLWCWAPAGKWVVPFWGQNEARLLCLMSKSIWTLCSATGHYKLVFYYLVLIEAVACPGCVLFNGCVSVLACANLETWGGVSGLVCVWYSRHLGWLLLGLIQKGKFSLEPPPLHLNSGANRIGFVLCHFYLDRPNSCLWSSSFLVLFADLQWQGNHRVVAWKLLAALTPWLTRACSWKKLSIVSLDDGTELICPRW